MSPPERRWSRANLKGALPVLFECTLSEFMDVATQQRCESLVGRENKAAGCALVEGTLGSHESVDLAQSHLVFFDVSLNVDDPECDEPAVEIVVEASSAQPFYVYLSTYPYDLSVGQLDPTARKPERRFGAAVGVPLEIAGEAVVELESAVASGIRAFRSSSG